MKLTNISNYPVTVNGVRIETDETEKVDIEDVEFYENDRRLSLEEEYKPADTEVSEGSDDEEESKPEEKTEKGD
jgi:hypothetical protein